MRGTRIFLLPWLFLLGLLSGCALFPPSHIAAKDTPYYKEGPQQRTPPDGFLSIGDQVWVWKSDKDGYSRIWLEDGTMASVWTDSLMARSKWKEAQAKKPPPSGQENPAK